MATNGKLFDSATQRKFSLVRRRHLDELKSAASEVFAPLRREFVHRANCRAIEQQRQKCPINEISTVYFGNRFCMGCRNKNPMLGTEFKVQFYNPETSSIKTASYSAYDHDYILRISRLFHSGGASLAKSGANNNDGEAGTGSGSDACCLFVWIVIRMMMLLALTIFSGTMAVFSIVAFVKAESPIFSVACLVPLVAFGLPLVALCVWSGWRFARTCQMLGEGPVMMGEDKSESYVKYGGENAEERV